MYNLVGHKWGPYSIIAHIGQDDLGVVYRAQEATSGRRVRLWILPFSMTRDNDALKRRLEMLVSRLQGLSHPHVAAVHGLEEVEGHLCVVLEDVPGQTLREVLIERKRLGAHQANKILQDLAAAVEALYQAGIQDLDLCPSHVVLTPSGQAVLVACEVIHLVRSMAIPSRGHAVVGSPVYIAPEMAKGSPPNGRSAV